MIRMVPTNKCHVEVSARELGDYGMFRIGKGERTPDEEYRACNSIADGIKRHVDDIGFVQVVRELKFVNGETDGEYDTLFDALADTYEYPTEAYTEVYTYRFRYPSNDVSTRSSASTFRELIEDAYNKPWKFEVTYASTPLTSEQQSFLDWVIVAGLESKNGAKSVVSA